MSARLDTVRQLHRARPRRPFVGRSLAVLVALTVVSWWAGGFQEVGLRGERQRANTARFLSGLQPWPVQQLPPEAGLAVRSEVARRWFAERWRDSGREALLATLGISLVAILLAGAAGALLSLPAARNFATTGAFGLPPAGATRTANWAWRTACHVVRAGLILARALPEYVWAFLLLALLGPTVWTMILALALHNTGILGKLTAELIENTEERASAALRGLGSARLPVVVAAVVPLTLPRFLLYFFYRWETCVREATVLGMLGIASLGFFIVEARARNAYDELLFLVICGALLVLAGDLVSALVRAALRRA